MNHVETYMAPRLDSEPQRMYAPGGQPLCRGRSRVFDFAALTCLVLILSLGVCAKALAFQDELSSIEQRVVCVCAGDTLWSLASSHPIEGLSTADTVEVIKGWNHLTTSCIAVGESLVVPSNDR